MKDKEDDVDLLKTRGGRIDHLRVPEGEFDDDTRVDQAIAESFPASDPPSWNSGLDEQKKRMPPSGATGSQPVDRSRRRPTG